MDFKEFGFKEEINKAIEDLGFKTPMPVQEQAIPTILYNDINLIALAQTGTGKTAAFGLPIINRIDFDNKDVQALVICPTRELCIQIANDLKKYSKYLKSAKIVPVYGGASIELQIKDLKKKPQIVVATPGRLNDLLLRKKIDISSINYMVLDEADEMLNMGFKDDLDNILSATSENKNTYLFSATMPKEVEQIAKEYISNPVRIQIGERNQGSDNVQHFYYLVHQKDRYLALKRIADYYPNIYGIIFCRTKVETQEVADMLIKDGYNADSLHGDLSQAQRDHVMSRFRLRNIQMLVATDVAARGLDVNNLTHVINYELPDELEQYVHRSGRTGRADNQGISIAIINLKEKHKIKKLEKVLKKEISKAKIPTGQEVCKKQLFNMINRVENVETDYEEIDRFLPEISKKLSWMDREELIKHFVSLEFTSLLSYYRDAVDLNIDESLEKEKIRRENNQRSKQKRERHFDKSLFSTLSINLGYKDKVVPQRIIGMINDYTPHRRIEIGKIDITDRCSFVEVKNDGVDAVKDALDGRIIKGKEIVVDFADNIEHKERKTSDTRERKGNRERRDSRGSRNRKEGKSRRERDNKDKRNRKR
ncbi:MAG: DEAD/DEAH box helicase [Synergistales bacterium]|nr:DEAD/DEAH box helicase [Bacteroidales bacterium]MDY6435265.1 DEAD/DEAH box helicase [Synergistales bacterium]MDY6393351.1 DEAD/DEAH box helicase [Bacteroidales bacterium]MDY6395874.1 DEAD/DEAH box helicase [Bacteroidales bacterium]MDY6402596.1 DEAD/DEAH box helicase [Bacteroidales bacterium]